MDFNRIQKLLVVFFLAFNVYLVFLLIDRIPIQSQKTTDMSAVSVVQDMRNRGVIIRPDLSGDTEYLPLIKTEPNNYLREQQSQLKNQRYSLNREGLLTSTFIEPVTLDFEITETTKGISAENAQIFREKYLLDETMFINGQAYGNYWYSNQEGILFCRMTAADGTPIVDGSSEIRVIFDDNFNMIGYTQTYQSEYTVLEEPKALISSQEAINILERRIETYLPNDSEIVSANLSYYRSLETDNFNIYTPAWEIIYYRHEGTITNSVIVDAVRGFVAETKSNQSR